MDKGYLFKFMRVKFQEAGFTPAEVELHMQSFAERYQDQTDEEIEADIKRRGGANRIVAAAVERRNTVLMADPDYRAFVAAEKKEEMPAAAAETTAAPQQKSEPIQPPQTEPQQTAAVPEEDPLASWFSEPVKIEKEDIVIVPQTSAEEPQKMADQEPVKQEAAKPTEQTVHSIPLFGDAGKQTAAGSQTVSAAEKPVPQQMRPQPQRAPMPHKPAADADLGHTKVVNVPQMERTERTAKPLSEAPKPAADPRSATKAYQMEQQAIWGASSEIRDQRSGGTRQTAVKTADRNAARPQAAAGNTAKPKKVEYTDRGTVTRLQEKTYWGEGSEEGVKRFRIIMAFAIPVAAVLLLAYAVIALGLIALMAVLMALFVAGLVVEVAVGSLIALVAVIYGISQIFLVLPVGLFELGLGVAAIGVTIFIGILMYNAAVRLLPFLMRQFIRFQSVFKGFLQDLYYYVKGECYRR